MLTLADALTDVATGAGWAGYGLSGLILAWFFLKHLPNEERAFEKKDALIRDLSDSKDKLVRELNESREHHERELALKAEQAEMIRRQDVKENLILVINHCERESQVHAQVHTAALGELEKAVIDLRTLMGEWLDRLIQVEKK